MTDQHEKLNIHAALLNFVRTLIIFSNFEIITNGHREKWKIPP